MPQVESSAVDRIHYTPASHTLDIWYKGGGQYRYFKVPRSLYDELLAAPSIGAFVNQHVKPNFDYVELSASKRFRPGHRKPAGS